MKQDIESKVKDCTACQHQVKVLNSNYGKKHYKKFEKLTDTVQEIPIDFSRKLHKIFTQRSTNTDRGR